MKTKSLRPGSTFTKSITVFSSNGRLGGRRIIEKHAGRTDLTEIDYLLHSPEDRAGALSFGRDKLPPAPVRKFNQIIQLEALLAAAEQFMDDEAAGKPVQPLREPHQPSVPARAVQAFARTRQANRRRYPAGGCLTLACGIAATRRRAR